MLRTRTEPMAPMYASRKEGTDGGRERVVFMIIEDECEWDERSVKRKREKQMREREQERREEFYI